jgi:hypothetical protein
MVSGQQMGSNDEQTTDGEDPRFLTPAELLERDPLADDPLREFFVWWDTITRSDADRLEQVLDEACRTPRTAEAVLQTYLEEHPLFLVQHLGGGHGRWVIPHPRFGNQLIPDFVMGDRHSGGFEWTLVELESPTARMFNAKGDPSATLQHALRQLTDWRVWLEVNQNYAARPRKDAGLGLTNISSNAQGLVLIGRTDNRDDGVVARRRRLAQDNNIKLHTYDWLVRQARDRSEAIERFQSKR